MSARPRPRSLPRSRRLPTSHHLPRPRVAALALLLAALLLTACSEVDRTVTERGTEVDAIDGTIRVLVWESDRYPDYRDRRAHCWDDAVVGEPVPDACLTNRTLVGETQPLRRSLPLAAASGILAIAALVWTARRRIVWYPFVTREDLDDPPLRPLTARTARSLARATSREKFEAGQRTRRPRWQLAVPALAGAALAAVALPPLVLLVGYGTALGWGLMVGLVLFIGVWATAIAYLTPLTPQQAQPDPLYARLAFLGGAATAAILAAAIGFAYRTPLLELNGLPF